MQQTNYIRMKTIDELKKYVETLYASKKEITVYVKKTRSKGESHTVIIEGIYAKFFTVRNVQMRLSFTIQYVDVITGNVTISEIAQEN